MYMYIYIYIYHRLKNFIKKLSSLENRSYIKNPKLYKKSVWNCDRNCLCWLQICNILPLMVNVWKNTTNASFIDIKINIL